MKIISIGLTVTAALAISGCTIESEKSDFICFNADVPGETGFRTVGLFESRGATTIGYLNDALNVVRHSECSAASVLTEGSKETFAWFTLGNAIENEEGLHSQEFYVNSSQSEALLVTRLEREGIRAIEDGPLNRVSYAEWPFEQNGIVVQVEDRHNLNTYFESRAIVGDTRKLKRFDENLAQYTCTYIDDSGVLAIDNGCQNESSFDVQFLGLTVNLDSYITEFKGLRRSYETDKEELWAEIARFR